MTTVKLPAAYDVSHYVKLMDIFAVAPKPSLFITKASEAYPGSIYYPDDDKFVSYATLFMLLHVRRGFYHFFRVLLDPFRQANHFINTLSKIDVLPSDILILDVEEQKCKASQMWTFFEAVRKVYPNNLLLLYSRKELLDQIVMTYSEAEYFKKIKIWAAGYPFSPDVFNAIPVGYMPTRDKYGETVLWQYGKQVLPGIIGDVDLNLPSPEFAKELGEISMVDTIKNYKGVTSAPADVFDAIGGKYLKTLPSNVAVTGDKMSLVSGINYLHLTSPMIGWTKVKWLIVTEDTPTTPPPPPVTPPAVEKRHIHIEVEGFKPFDGELEKL